MPGNNARAKFSLYFRKAGMFLLSAIALLILGGVLGLWIVSRPFLSLVAQR